jgi:hypothetical protein
VIEPRIYATSALAFRRSYHSAIDLNDILHLLGKIYLWLPENLGKWAYFLHFNAFRNLTIKQETIAESKSLLRGPLLSY